MDRLRKLHAASGLASSRLKEAAASWYGGVALGALLGLAAARVLR